MKPMSLVLALGLVGITLSFAQTRNPRGTRDPLEPSTITKEGDVIIVTTGKSLFPEPDESPFELPPGTNFLPTVYTNMFDASGKEMPNTLPSTPTIPYNLHEGEPVVTLIDKTSPTDDLESIFALLLFVVCQDSAISDPKLFHECAANNVLVRTRWNALGKLTNDLGVDPVKPLQLQLIQLGLDILEGNPIRNRVYSGFPLLHYKGPKKLGKVEPIKNEKGEVIGGNIHVRQIWYDSHIESDIALINPGAVSEVPWTITYTVDVLNRGRDDFSPFVMYSDGAMPNPRPHVGMDATFFPMQEGTRTILKLKMAPGKYYNLIYTWGWRMHPPRVQVTENVLKQMGFLTDDLKEPPDNAQRDLLEWETSVFGQNPTASDKAKLDAIAKIGDLAPEKRMWNALRKAQEDAMQRNWVSVLQSTLEARDVFSRDWRFRTRLPRGIEFDKDSDLTLLYVNNTIYAQFSTSDIIQYPKWQKRGTELKVTLYNGDYFDHGYQNVDFGGARGWENQFQSSVKVGGSGCWFTFGRAYFSMNIPGVIKVPAATKGSPDKLGVQKVRITYNYEPSRRLRFYQFDPMHHDVAVFSVH
jgi:hypothetical protein